ncbi:unnamed protein product, partial [Mesorhabditis spiculigera]
MLRNSLGATPLARQLAFPRLLGGSAKPGWAMATPKTLDAFRAMFASDTKKCEGLRRMHTRVQGPQETVLQFAYELRRSEEELTPDTTEIEMVAGMTERTLPHIRRQLLKRADLRNLDSSQIIQLAREAEEKQRL